MNKYQKKLHGAVKVAMEWCKGTEYEFITYRYHKIATKECWKQYGINK